MSDKENSVKIINEDDVSLLATAIDAISLLPVASFSVAAYKAISKLNEDQFAEKLQAFLENITASPDEKKEFVKALDKDGSEFFKRLLKVLDRVEDKAKCPIIARLYTATIKGFVSVDEFKRLCSTIDKTYISTLEFLGTLETLPAWERIEPSFKRRTDYEKKKETEQELFEKQQLVAIGLLIERANSYTELQHGTNRVTEGKDYFLTSLGTKFLTFGLTVNKKEQ